MAARTRAKVSGNAVAWVRAVVSIIVDGGDPPPSRSTLYKRVPQQVGGGAAAPADGGPSARGDGRSTAVLNDLAQANFQAGQRIWIDAVVDDLLDQGAVVEEAGGLRWTRDLHRDMTVTFHDMTIRVDSPEERQRSDELGAIDLTLRGAGHLNRVLIAEGGGISGNARFRAGERVALEVHPVAFELPPMNDAELERLAADVKAHGIVTPLLLMPDHADPLRKQTAKPGQQPLVLDKDGNPIPKLKVGDGRHRLFLASRFDLPVRLEVFEGTEQEARERIVSLNINRRMLSSVQIGILIRQLLLPEEKRKASERMQAGVRTAREQHDPRADLPKGSDAPVSNGRAEKAVLKRLGNPIGERTLRTLKETDDAPETREKAMRGDEGYRSASAVAKKARVEKGEPALEPARNTRGDRYAKALYELRQAHREFDPGYPLRGASADRIERLQAIVNEALTLIRLERDAGQS